MTRNTWFQALILVIAAAAIAIVANGFAPPQRRLVLPGWYPDALRVPPHVEAAPSGQVVESASRPVETTATIATVAPPTTTLAPIATTTTTAATTTTVATTTTTSPTQPLAHSPTPTPVPAPAPEKTFAPHPDKAYIEVTGDDVAALHAKGALFLDARRTSVYEQGHIAGARSYSVWEADIDDKVSKLFDERSDQESQNKPIVVYCSGGACEDSHMLAQKLWGIQFNNVYVYRDGFPDWQNRGGAVHTGAQP